jgi:hypothetical protein
VKRALALFSFLPVALSACSSDGLTDEGEGADGSAGAGGAAASGGSAGSTGTCAMGPGYADPTEPQQVGEVSASLVDQDGAPLALELVQICGTDICINGSSNANGGVVMAPNQPIRKPAFKFGEGKISATFAWLLPEEPVVDLGTVTTVRLPELGSGATLTPGEPASSGGLTLTPGSGSRIRFDTIVFRTPEERQLRAVRVPLESAPAVVNEDYGFELVYAATPTDTEFCPPAALEIDNSQGWAAGTDVEVWLHGVKIEQVWAPYGGWAKVSDARVSEDGERIETTGPGLPMLGVLAFKRR